MKKKSSDREYAFLMINYETPSLIKDLQKQVKDSELYVKDGKYGLEKETHVTLVPCLENDVNIDELKTLIEPLKKYEILLTNISKFECQDFDVLKCDVFSQLLFDTNKKIKDKYPTHSEHKEYHPHVTIAYLKKGMADKYLKDIITPLVVLKPTEFHFSWIDKEKGESDKYFKN